MDHTFTRCTPKNKKKAWYKPRKAKHKVKAQKTVLPESNPHKANKHNATQTQAYEEMLDGRATVARAMLLRIDGLLKTNAQDNAGTRRRGIIRSILGATSQLLLALPAARLYSYHSFPAVAAGHAFCVVDASHISCVFHSVLHYCMNDNELCTHTKQRKPRTTNKLLYYGDPGPGNQNQCKNKPYTSA